MNVRLVMVVVSRFVPTLLDPMCAHVIQAIFCLVMVSTVMVSTDVYAVYYLKSTCVCFRS